VHQAEALRRRPTAGWLAGKSANGMMLARSSKDEGEIDFYKCIGKDRDATTITPSGSEKSRRVPRIETVHVKVNALGWITKERLHFDVAGFYG
jgi:hypothetical protein